MSTYILKKDLPNLKAGAEFVFNGATLYVCNATYVGESEGYPVASYSKEQVEGNSEWFEKKEVIKLFNIDEFVSINPKPINRIVLNLNRFSPENRKKLDKAQMDGLMDDWRYGYEISFHPDDEKND